MSGGAVPVVPNLNLRKMLAAGKDLPKNTQSTRVPVSTERTASVISMLN